MALKSTIYKAQLQIADMDRQVYADHALTLARHPSETDERMMVRLLAFALHAPADDHDGALTFTAGLSDTDAPDLWQRAHDGRILQWIEVGQPDDRRLLKACGRAEQVSVYCYAPSAPIWWQGIAGKLARARGLTVWRLDAAASRELAGLAQRSMSLQVTVQEGSVWVGDGNHAVELAPQRLLGG